jgi:hypothetical protein
MVELGLIAKAAEDEFRGEAGVTRVKLGRVFQQQVRCVAACFDLAKNIERDLACD